MSFDNYANRKLITEGFLNPHEGRFEYLKIPPISMKG